MNSSKHIRLLLHSSQLSDRGDSVNASNYARAMKQFYNIDSVICYPATSPDNSPFIISELLSAGFFLVPYSSASELHSIGKSLGITHAYFLIDGTYNPLWVKNARLINHSVFNFYEPHGDKYGYVSEWLFKRALRTKVMRNSISNIAKLRGATGSPYGIDKALSVSWVPHCVYPMHGDGRYFRRKHGISESAKLVGRIGGYSQFNEIAAWKAVQAILRTNSETVFCFVNTMKFVDHPRAIFLDVISRSEVWDFYCAGDLFLNGRLAGESFGFSIVEPLSVGKPVIAPSRLRNWSMDLHHVDLLGELGLTYWSTFDLVRKIQRYLFDPPSPSLLIGVVDKFSPRKVADRFMTEFLL